MLTFFRKIRQHLISERKIATYLKNALGEIVLVMIGILLALQVTNWNENRKNETLKRPLIANLKVNLEMDIQNLQVLNIINTNAEKEDRLE